MIPNFLTLNPLGDHRDAKLMADRGHGIHHIIFKGKTIKLINEMAGQS